ncbi:restriction endonuclease [Streptomyces mayteni]
MLAVVWSLFIGVMRWLAEHPGIFVLLLLATVAAALSVRRQWQGRGGRPSAVPENVPGYAIGQIDGLHHRDFEYAIRDLMRRDGCANAVQVGGAGDNGADVKATDPCGRRWVIQCKHRKAGLHGAAVGVRDLHVLNGTGRPVHHGDVIVLVTNGRFTSNARDFARSQRLHLVDRHVLAKWATGPTPLWHLLRAVPAPRRPTRP